MKAVNVDDILKILHEYGKYIFVTDEKKYSDMVNEIANLKALEQEPCVDTISREVACKFLTKARMINDSRAMEEIFAEIPSVTPEEPINHELFRKALKHRLYERYMDNPAEFKALCGLIDDVESVIKHNAECWQEWKVKNDKERF